MGTRESRAHAGPLKVEDQGLFPPLSELALALPWKMVHATWCFIRPAVVRLDRGGIIMPSMSGAWLIQYKAACGKQGDPH